MIFFEAYANCFVRIAKGIVPKTYYCKDVFVILVATMAYLALPDKNQRFGTRSSPSARCLQPMLLLNWDG